MYMNISDNTLQWNQNYVFILQSLTVTGMEICFLEICLFVNDIFYCTPFFLRHRELKSGAFITVEQ